MFTDEDIKQAAEAEEWHRRIARCVHLKGGATVITHEFDSVLYLDQLMQTAKRIGYTSEPVSRLVSARTGRAVARLTRAGTRLELACTRYRDACYVWKEREEVPRYGNHRFHPILAVMLKAVDEWHEQVSDAKLNRDQARLHSSLTSLAETIRDEFQKSEFQTEVRNYRRNAEQKLRRALRYLLSLFRGHSRLLILRLDLYIRKKATSGSYSEEADRAFDRFVDALTQNKIVPDVLGWMSAREDGIERGVHYHVLVAVDGHEHRAGANLARMLGEYWERESVGGGLVGSYYNCFGMAHKYKHLGIGLIHCADARKLLGLYYAVRYLCKDEVQLIATGERTRNFRRGIELKETTRRGAPRRNGDDLSLARSVLLGQLRPVKPRGSKNRAVSSS